MRNPFSQMSLNNLRLLTIFVSFLFIPAFMFGVASVWSVVFAFVMAFYFKSHMIFIYNLFSPRDGEIGAAMSVVKKVFKVICECMIIISLP